VRNPRAILVAGLLVVSSAAAGCKTVYIPNVVNVPLLEQKGELRASVNTNNAELAYAATDHVGVMLNGYYEKSSPDATKTSGQGGKGYLVEGAGGYFTHLPGLPLPLFELYGGAGVGHVRHDNWETINSVRSDYGYQVSGFKLFLQPSAGITLDWLDAALSGRLVGIKTFGVKAENYPDQRLMEDDLFQLDHHFWVFWEPAVTVRAGYKWAKVFAQYGYSIKLNEASVSRRAGFLYFGLHFTFADRFRAPRP
jgi:hypothetical protein